MFIYKITNKINQKIYIGLDSGPMEEMRRWRKHQAVHQTYVGKSKLYASMKKHGLQNFLYEVIDTAISISELKDKEEYWIAFFDTCSNGYNMIPTSNGGWTVSNMSPEDRQARIESCKRGASASNKIKWETGSNIDENRNGARASLNNFYKQTDRASFVKANWESLSDQDRFNKTDGLRKHWDKLSSEERSERALNGSLKALEKNAKRYFVYDPSGIEYYAIGLGVFCKQHGLDKVALQKVSTGRLDDWNGWKCYEVNKETNKKIIPEKFVDKRRKTK